MQRRLFPVLVLVAAALGGAAVGRSVPGPDGRITACYTTGTTNVRLVDDPATCAQFQASAVSWAQSGPAGPQGTAGPQGPAGPAGPQGPAGSVPDPTADRLTAQIKADAKTLVRLRSQIRALDRGAAATRAAATQAQIDQMAKLMEVMRRLLEKSNATAQSVIDNLK